MHNISNNFCLDSVPRESVLLILRTINFLRKFTTKKIGDPNPSAAERFWHANFWEDMDHMLIARAALHVGAHCTALLYVEIWHEAECGQVTLLPPEGENADMDIDKSSGSGKATRVTKYKRGAKAKPQIPTASEEARREARELLMDIFASIGEPDSFYGLDTTFDSITPQLAIYVHEQNWPKALGTYDMVLQHSSTSPAQPAGNVPTAAQSPASSAQLQSPSRSPSHAASPLRASHASIPSASLTAPSQFSLHEGLMTSLQNLGQYHILDFYLKGFQKQYPNLEGKKAYR